MFVDDSNRFVADLGQNPISNVGTNRLIDIRSSLVFISSTIANAGILGPKKTRLHIDNKYIGVRTKPIAEIIIVIDRKVEVKPS